MALTAVRVVAIIPVSILNRKGSFTMARKKAPQRRDWRMILFLAVSVIIVLSMILFMVLPALPGS